MSTNEGEFEAVKKNMDLDILLGESLSNLFPSGISDEPVVPILNALS